MEEDRDLEELKKAIDAGDKERAKGIAITLLKQRSKLGNPNQASPNPSWIVLVILAVCALAPVVVTILEMWMKQRNPNRKEVHAYV